MKHWTDPFGNPIIFFDGVCNLCQGSVKFILKHEKSPALRFAPLQSDYAREVLEPAGFDLDAPTSVVLLEHGILFTEARAALRLAAYLKAPWNFARIFAVLPDFLLNPIYRWVARNRYRWFGKSDACMLPTEDLRARFLE